MTIGEWALLVLYGGLFGAIGQAVRVTVGLKKVNDQSRDTGKTFKELLVPSAMVTSLMIGFVAGGLAAISLDLTLNTEYTSQVVLALLASGYSGADFIEGLMSRYLPGRDSGGSGSQGGAAGPVPGGSAAEGIITGRAGRLPTNPL